MSEPKEVFELETQEERLLSTAASDRSPDNSDGKRLVLSSEFCYLQYESHAVLYGSVAVF